MRTLFLLGLVALAPAALATELSSEEIRSLVMRSLKAWETLDERDFTDTAHPDLVFAYPGQRTDRQRRRCAPEGSTQSLWELYPNNESRGPAGATAAPTSNFPSPT